MRTSNNFLNTLLWLCMLALAILVFWIAEGSDINSGLVTLLILGVALVKFLGIGFQFMELKNAHLTWKVLFSIFILTEIILIWAVS